ncbi:hypothetical protein HMN09_01365200 [Mycena chlorophos]|uniref:MYND-type domain-containing protein n=1 Tax=Mycena chlorophos TaxID=658473 RepID=A0A8H6RY54_MYCCL|nr:hypothetical protein HMN09_01365200 [Mycena chlorophos]
MSGASFPANFRKLATGIEKGVLSDITAATLRIKVGLVPLTPAVVDLFLRHFDDLPRNPFPTDESGTRIVAYLEGLRTCLSVGRKKGRPDLDVSNVRSRWPRIAHWLFEFEQAAADRLEDTKDETGWRATAGIIKNIIYDASEYDAMTATMRAAEPMKHVLATLASIFTIEAEHRMVYEPGSITSVTTLHAFLTPIVLPGHSVPLRFQTGQLEPEAAIIRVFSDCFRDKAYLAQLILRHIDLARRSAKGESHPMHIVVVFNVITLLICDSEGIGKPLVQQKPMFTVVRVLRWAAQSKHPPAQVAHVVSEAVGFITSIMRSTNGYGWIAHALRAGILVSLFECAKFYTERSADHEQPVSIVLEALTVFLTYRSVVRQALKAVAKLQKRGFDIDNPPFEGRLRFEWSEFLRILHKDRRLLKFGYDVALRYKCRGAKCEVTKQNMTACAGCRVLRYCSIECQKKDWPDHKQKCAEQLRLQELGAERTTYPVALHEDIRFWEEVASYDIRELKKELLIKRGALVASTPPSRRYPCFIKMDYLHHPMKYEVRMMAPDEPLLDRRVTLQLARKLRDMGGTYVEMMMPHGRGAQQHHAWLDGMDDWDSGK